MKKTILLSSVAVMSAVATFAQTKAPQSFNYQGAARKSDGTPLANQDLSLRLSIIKDTENGTVEYYEVRAVKTNTLGLYTVSIGSGVSVKDNTLVTTGGLVAFNQIAWGASAKYFKVEVDPNAGNDFALAGVSPIAAVPYALYSERGGTSAFNYWASLPENAGRTEADFITYLKEQAVSDVANTAKDLSVSDVDGILTVTGGEGAVLKAAEIKLDKAAFDKAARQAAIDGLNGKDGGDGTSKALVDAVTNVIKTGIDGTNGEDGALKETVNNTVNTLIQDGKINGKDAAVNNAGTNADGSILAFNAGNQAVLKDLQLILDKTALNNETKQSIIDGLNGLDGTNGSNGIDGKLQDAITKAVTNGLNGVAGTDGSNGADGVNTKLVETITKVVQDAVTGDGIKGKALTTDYAAGAPEANKFLTVQGNGAEALLKEAQLAIDPAKFNKAVADAITGANGANGAAGEDGTTPNAGVGKDLAKITGDANVLDIVAINGGVKSVLSETSLGIDKTGFDNASKQSVIDGLTGQDGKAGQDGINGNLQDAINKAVANGLNGLGGSAGANGADGADGANTIIKNAIEKVVSQGADKSLEFGAPNVALAGAADKADAASGTITPATTADGKAQIQLNTAGEKAKGVVSNEDIKSAVAAGLNAANTDPAGTNAGDPAVNTALNNAVNNAIKNGKDADGNSFAKKLTPESFITVSKADNKALLEDLTVGVDQNILNADVAKTLKDGLKNADGTAVDPASNPLADAVKDAVAAGILNGKDGAAGADGIDGKLADAVKDAVTAGILNGKDGKDGAAGIDGKLADAVQTIVKENSGVNFAFGAPGTALAGAADKADATVGTVTPGDATNPATLTINAAGENAKGLVSKKDIKDIIAGDGTTAGIGKDFKTANANGAGTEANILQIGDSNTATTAAAAALKEIDLKINKGALNKNTIDALKGTDGTNGANTLQDAVKDVITNAIANGKDGAAGAAGADGKLATAVQTIVKETANTNFAFGAASPAKADGTGGVITPGAGATPATISLAKAGATTPGVVSQQDIKDVIAGTTGTAGIGKDLSVAGLAKISAGDATGATLKAVTVSVSEADVQKSVADGITAGTDPLKTALDGANAKLIADPASKTAKALGDAAKDTNNPLNKGIDAGVGALVKNPASETSKGLVDALNPATGTGNTQLQDAIKGLTAKNADDLLTVGTAGTAPTGAGDVATAKLGTVTPSTDGTAATLTLNQAGDKAPGVISKDAVKNSIASALTGAAGAAGTADKALQDAVKGALNNNITAVAPATTSSPNGLVVGKDAAGKTTLQLAPADATNPGIVTAGNQTFGGNKTFAGNTTLGSNDPKTTTTINGNVVLGTDAAKNIKDAIANNGAALKTQSFITATTADNAAKALLNEVTLGIDNDKLNDEVAKSLTNGKADKSNPLADAVKAATAATAGTASTAVQNVKVAGDGAAAITAAKGADNAVTLTVNKATDAAAGVVTLTDVRNAVAGTGAGANRLDKGNITKTTGTDNILTINGGTNSTFNNVDLGVTKTAVQGAVAEGLAKTGGNDALKNAVAQANADALKDGAATTGSANKAFQDAVKDVITAGNTTGGAGIGKALTSADITVTGGDKAVLNATALAIKDGAITGAKLANDAVTSDKIANGTVTGADLAGNTVAGANIAPNAITTDKIQDGTITGADLANATVTPDKLKSTDGTGANVASGLVPVADGKGGVTYAAPSTAATNVTGAQAITSPTNTVTVTGGNASVLKAVTLEVNQAGLNLATIGGKLPVAKIDGTGATAGQVPTVGADGAVSFKDLPKAGDATLLSNKKDITSTDLTVTNGVGAVVSAANVNLAIAANAITSAKIADGTVTGNDLAPNTVAGANIAPDAITSAKIADGTVTGNDLAANTVAGANIAPDAITSDKIKDGTITGADLAANTVTGGNIAPKTITPDKMLATAADAGKTPVVGADGTVTWGSPKTAATDVTGAQNLSVAGLAKITSGTGTGATLKAVTVGVSDADVQGSIVKGLGAAAPDANDALKAAVKAAAPTLSAATPANGVTVTKDATGNYTVGATKATDTEAGTVTLADVKTAATAGTTNTLTLGGAAPATATTVTSTVNGKAATLDLGSIEPWKVAGTAYATPATTSAQTIVHEGAVAIGRDATFTPFLLTISGNTPYSDVSKSGIQSGIVLQNPADKAENVGVKITMGPSTQTQFTDFVTYSVGTLKNYTAFGIRNTSNQTEYLTLETGTGTGNSGGSNDKEGNLGLGVRAATDAADQKASQRLDVNGNVRVRKLADGSNATNYPNVVVADANGVLGKTTLSAVVKANAPTLAEASPANGVTVTKDATGNYTVGATKATDTGAGTLSLNDVKAAALAAGQALTSTDITVTGGEKAVLTAATLAIKDGAITSAKLKATNTDGSNATAGTVPVAGNGGTVTYQPASSLVQFGQQRFTATASQTTFSVAGLPADYAKVFVFRNGAKLVANEDYTVTAGTVTLVGTNFVGGGVAAGDAIEVQFAK